MKKVARELFEFGTLSVDLSTLSKKARSVATSYSIFCADRMRRRNEESKSHGFREGCEAD